MKPTFFKGIVLGAVISVITVMGTAAFAGSGVGAIFNLGKFNGVNATTGVGGSTAGPQLYVSNISNQSGATGLRIKVHGGKAPLSVNSSTKVANLNADKLDGLDSSELQRAVTARTNSLGGCDPDSTTRLTCIVVPLTLSAPSRVLVLGRIRAITDNGQVVGYGSCNLGVNISGPIAGSTIEIATDNMTLDQIPLMAVTGVIGPGAVSFGIDCNQEPRAGGIRYDFAQVTAVALSPN